LQGLWTNGLKWREIFTSARWGQSRTLSWSSLWVGPAADCENKTFHNLGKTGSELKLTDFQEKSSWPKSSILAPRLALQEVGVKTIHIPASCGTTLRTPVHQIAHPTKKAWVWILWAHPHAQKLFDREEQHPLSHSPTYQSEEEVKTQRPCQKCHHLNYKSEERAQITHWTEKKPLPPIIRKKFGQ
jgi:hypothetical protein